MRIYVCVCLHEYVRVFVLLQVCVLVKVCACVLHICSFTYMCA